MTLADTRSWTRRGRGGQLARRRGTVLLPVLAAAMIVSIAGLAAVCLVRIQRRASQLEQQMTEARLNARSALELAFQGITAYPQWRTLVSNGTWITDRPLGRGTWSLAGIDPTDGNLTDSAEDPVVLTGTGACGPARHKMQVTLVPAYTPLPFLRTALHAAGQLQIKSGRQLTTMGGPASTNGTLRLDGRLDGDGEAAVLAGGGICTGTLKIPSPAKAMPDAGVFDRYRTLAVTIPYSGSTMERFVLSPGANPWGVTSADGVYYLDTLAHDVTIRGARIWGTLVVRTGGKKLVLSNAVFLHPVRPDYPVLIVDGNVELSYDTSSQGLSEPAWLTNFNPPSTPYENSDNDTLDTYPNEVQGLVHVKGTILMNSSAWVRGAVICENAVTCDGNTGVIYDLALWTDPPMGYRTVRMRIASGSWQQVVD